MRVTIKRLLIAGIIILGAAFNATALEVYGTSDKVLDFYRGNDLLREWRVVEARLTVDDLLAADPTSAAGLNLDAHVKFFEGRYDESLKSLEGLGFEDGFRDLVKATAERAANFKSRQSEHFRVYWDNPRDEVMVDEALSSLETAFVEVEKILGFTPEGIVRVEIYPSVADFTAVSTLTKKEVETSGTIGLCKFNRIMITSPRATIWGFRWKDTLAHEYIHLALFRLSRAKAPIWVHEGLARYFEGAWRGRIGEPGAMALALLARRYAEGTLIPLEKMSPSVAKLPSAEDTSLAFAQVGTMMGFLREKRGDEALTNLVRLIGEGKGDREALETVWRGSFASFEESWKGWVETMPTPDETPDILGIALHDGGPKIELEPGKVPDTEASGFSRIGDMLRGRGRMKAAAVEYEKAFDLMPKNASIASRYALGKLFVKEYDEALSAVEGVLGIYEDRGVLWSRKGEALLGLERYDAAASAFKELMEINPFDEPGRVSLLDALKKAGDEEGALVQEKMIDILSSGIKPEGHK